MGEISTTNLLPGYLSSYPQAFYINLVIGGLLSPVYIFLLPSVSLQSHVPLGERLTKRIDWMGNLSFAGATSALTMALTFGGTAYTWESRSEILLWVFTGVLYIAFFLSQWFHPFVEKEHRLFPTQLVKHCTLALLQVCSFMAAACLLVGLPHRYSWS